ncbi:hypothetical protein ADUPG1_008303, partial [Aduncisulcus paluster]
MWDTFHLPLLIDSEGILRILLNYFILPFLVLVLSSLLFFGNSNPTLYAHHPSEFLGYTVDRNVGDAFGHVSDISISMNCRDCFISSYSMMLTSFSSDRSGLIISLSESTSSSLSPHSAHQSPYSSCCRLCSACSSAFAPGYVMAGHPNRYDLSREIANDLTHSIDILSCPTMPLSEDHSFLHPHPLGLLIAALSITLLVVSIISTMLTTGNRMNSIPSMLIFLAVLCVSFQSVLGYGFSEECSMYLSEDDHLVCNEIYPGRYAAECEEGYYYDQGDYSCVYDTNTDCPSDMNDHQMCVKTTEDLITSDCRSAWYGDDCDQLYQVHIPDPLFRGTVCTAADYSYSPCDVSEFEMAAIGGYFYADEPMVSNFQGAEYLINIVFFSGKQTNISLVSPLPTLLQLSILNLESYMSAYNLNIYDFSNIYPLNRLTQLSLDGNDRIYDISVSFRNIGMTMLSIANTECSIPLCRSESDDDYWSFITSVFPIHDLDTESKKENYLPNDCPLNSGSYICSPNNSTCPSIVRNEVFNSLDGAKEKKCAFIAKEGANGQCYTVHDDFVRQYLIYDCLPNGSEDLTSGIISVATMRTKLTCSSLSLPGIVSSSYSVSTVDEITTLQGLEYAQGTDSDGKSIGLTSLNIDGYDLSGDINENAEYDKLVVQILAKAVVASNSYGSINSGLTSLSASGCGLSAVSDVLDLTPIANGDSATGDSAAIRPFKLTSLDLSNNNISDVSVLITSSMFPENVLTTLDISGNNICDIDNVVTMLQSYFTNIDFAINATSQSTCPCSEGADVSFSSHKTCRKRSNGYYQVECWNGYFLDIETNSCVEAVSSAGSIRCQVCEKKDIFVPILDLNTSDISCGCSFGFHGDSCEYVDIPDSNLRSAVCLAVVNPSAHDSSCDDLTISDMTTVTSVSASIVDSFEGLQSAVNLTSLSIFGTSSSSVSIGNTDLGYLPLSLVELSLEAVYLAADSDFSIFPNLTTLSLKNNSSYDLTNSALFPSSSSSSSSTFTWLDVSYTALSSFSSIPTSITTLTANNCSSLTSFSTISNLTNLVSLDVSYALNVSDFSSLLSNIPLTISILYADGCNVSPDTDFTTFTNLTTLSLNDNTEYDISESGLFPSSLTSLSANNTSISLLFHLAASMPNLTELSLNNNNISDPSPLYALSSNTSLSSIDLSYNHICGGDNGGDSVIETFLASKFSISAADVNASGQECECSSGDLGSTPLTANKVCAETLPGVSNLWYVVCASDSYTSYTDASTFACISPDNGDGTFGCSGGCEYGQECRYDSTLTSTSCQQVIVNESLHACVADMFVDSDGNADYEHRTDSTPSLFSVASLKTLESVDDGSGVYSPVLSCPTLHIVELTGIEHITKITGFDLSSNDLDTSASTECLDSLMHLSALLSLDLSSNSNITTLPDLRGMSSLTVLR